MWKQHNNFRASAKFCFLFLICSFSGVAMALTVERLSFEDLVSDADAIVIGVVDKAEAAYGEGKRDRRIFTSYSLTPSRVLKGGISVELPYRLSIIGGRVGDMTHHYPGVPQLKTGARYLLFIVGNGEYAVPIVGTTQGTFKIVEKEPGIEQVVPMQGAQLISRNNQDAKMQTENDKETTLEAFIERIEAELR